MKDGRIPKDILYDELASGARSVGRPLLRYRDVIKRDMSELNLSNWESLAADRAKWRALLHKQLLAAEEKTITTAKRKKSSNT